MILESMFTLYTELLKFRSTVCYLLLLLSVAPVSSAASTATGLVVVSRSFETEGVPTSSRHTAVTATAIAPSDSGCGGVESGRNRS